jgi:hypothetical protein
MCILKAFIFQILSDDSSCQPCRLTPSSTERQEGLAMARLERGSRWWRHGIDAKYAEKSSGFPPAKLSKTRLGLSASCSLNLLMKLPKHLCAKALQVFCQQIFLAKENPWNPDSMRVFQANRDRVINRLT